jgi:hypothetical protein
MTDTYTLVNIKVIKDYEFKGYNLKDNEYIARSYTGKFDEPMFNIIQPYSRWVSNLENEAEVLNYNIIPGHVCKVLNEFEAEIEYKITTTITPLKYKKEKKEIKLGEDFISTPEDMGKESLAFDKWNSENFFKKQSIPTLPTGNPRLNRVGFKKLDLDII